MDDADITMMQTKGIPAGQLRKGSSCVKSQTYQGAATKSTSNPVASRNPDMRSLH